MVRAFAYSAMGRRIVLHGRPIELFLVPASATWCVLSYMWDGADKITIAVNRKE